jgi:hypothetical protein
LLTYGKVKDYLKLFKQFCLVIIETYLHFKVMLKINRFESKGLTYYEALFLGGNLYAYSIKDLISQLVSIYGFKVSLFEFNLN